MGKGWSPGEWLWEDGGSGGGPSPFSGLTMGERRPGPNLEETEAAVSRVGSGVGARGMATAACFPPARVSSLAGLLDLVTV